MKGKILIIGAVIVAVVLVILAWGTGVIGANPYWETENDFGAWGEEIIITYTDGTTKSLKLLSPPLFELTYYGQGINTVEYQLSAKATGTGYTEALIKITSYVIQLKILTDSGSTIWSDVVSKGTVTDAVPLDNNWHLLALDGGADFWDIFEDHDWADGTYKLTFTPGAVGTPIYWGEPGQTSADGVRVNLPSGLDMTVEWKSDAGTLTVILGEGIET